jgi:hypothetical protein
MPKKDKEVVLALASANAKRPSEVKTKRTKRS